MKNIAGRDVSYPQTNDQTKAIRPGSDGVKILPFGNGAERVLNNKIIGASIHDVDFNKHSPAHLFRAAQEGIAFALRYGLDIMRENGMNPKVIRASKANMFLSEVFTQTFANVNNVAVEFYDGDGSYGAAIGAGIGSGIFSDGAAASKKRKPLETVQPQHTDLYNELYEDWKELLQRILIDK
jgi:xylulokinase